MKILLATDGSSHSKAMVKKFVGRTFAHNTKVRIISAYERPYMTYASPMGAMNEYNAEADKFLQKSAAAATENAATILRKINPSFLFLLLLLKVLQRLLSWKKLKNLLLI